MNSTLWSVTLLALMLSCQPAAVPPASELWQRYPDGPVFRDPIPGAGYQVASDPHVFLADGALRMVYTGDDQGYSTIKLAAGSDWDTWQVVGSLLAETGPSGLDRNKETPFYRRTAAGKHQIYYIGYADEDTYQAQLFLAEADSLRGPYQRMAQPIIPRGTMAGKEVYCITSPSVVSHEGKLYLSFLAWNDAPARVSQVWVMGATSTDEGHSWSEVKQVEVPIGMEGQVTRVRAGAFVAVRTGGQAGREAIFYATAAHPFGPWREQDTPLLRQAGAPYETDEIIAPQLTLDPATGQPVLYYTGANYRIGWWVMLARPE